MVLTDIIIYPIKSLGGISLQKSPIDKFGLKYDRRWMLIDASGKYLTMREHHTLCYLQVHQEDRFWIVTDIRNQDFSIRIPIDECSDRELVVKVWDNEVNAYLVSELIDGQFSEFLGIKCHLVFMPEEASRLVNVNYASNKEETAFSDGFPLLMIGQSSLDFLNEKLVEKLPMDRFRPNLVFKGGQAHEEDNMNEFFIGDVLLKGVKLCSRCVVTTIDRRTGLKGKEPLKTLASYRLMDKEIKFGQNVLVQKGTCLEVGAPLKKVKNA